jgi:two-component system response regulator AtoC
MPTLRERREDIPYLAEFFRKHHEQQFGLTTEPFPPGVLEYLQNLNWNGNVRELSNIIARYLLIGPEAILPQDVSDRRNGVAKAKSENAEVVPLKRVAKEAIREMERNLILETLRMNQWNRRKTALALKISYRSLIYKIRSAGLISSRPTEFRKAPQRTPQLRDAAG